MHAVMRSTEAHIRSNDGYQPSSGWCASSDPAMEPVECQSMIGWGALPRCQEHRERAVKEWWGKKRRMANASLRQSVTFLLAECDTWPEVGREVMGLRGRAGNRRQGEKGKIYSMCITTVISGASPEHNPTSTVTENILLPLWICRKQTANE